MTDGPPQPPASSRTGASERVPATLDARFLRGRRGIGTELWRSLRIWSEFVRGFWTLRPFLRETMIAHRTIDESDLSLVFQTDDPDEVATHNKRKIGG